MNKETKDTIQSHLFATRMLKNYTNNEGEPFTPFLVTFDDKGAKFHNSMLDFSEDRKRMTVSEALGLVAFDPSATLVMTTLDAFWKEVPMDGEDLGTRPSEDPTAHEGLITSIWFKDDEGQWQTSTFRDTYRFQEGEGLVWDEEFSALWDEWQQHWEDTTVQSWFHEAFRVVCESAAGADFTLSQVCRYIAESDAHMLVALRDDILEEVGA